MTRPKRLYSATISYRTPARRRVLYGTIVAARNRLDCESRLRARLAQEAKYGRRRVATVLDDFHFVLFAMQIVSGRSRRRRREMTQKRMHEEARGSRTPKRPPCGQAFRKDAET